MPGRRERKKQVTRQALVEAAVALFTERGYDATTVADIAVAADVSTRTFFLHFATKEDVLLADTGGRVERGVRALADGDPAAPVGAALAAAMGSMIDDVRAGDLDAGVGALRARLAVHHPAVQARLLQTAFVAQRRLAAALHEAHPERLDDVAAAALVGAVAGAVGAAALTALGRGATADEVRNAMRRAAALALRAAEGV